MTTLTVEIDKEQDLTMLQTLFTRLDLRYTVEDEWGGDVTDEELEGLKAGLADIASGRTHTNDDVMARIDQKLENFRNR